MKLTDAEIAKIASEVGEPQGLNGSARARRQQQVERIRAMRDAGFSQQQIADYLGVSYSTVYRRLRAGGV